MKSVVDINVATSDFFIDISNFRVYTYYKDELANNFVGIKSTQRWVLR